MVQRIDSQITTTMPLSPLSQKPPERLPTDPFIYYAIDGFLRGLEEVGFAMDTLPEDFRRQLRKEDYEMPDNIWTEINELTLMEQAKVIYWALWHIHLCQALYLALTVTKEGENPRETFRGREPLALPILLAGEANFRKTLEKLKPLLPKFGLDKGATRDLTSNANYPEVIRLFYKMRSDFFRFYLKENYDEMYRFIKEPRNIVPEWPQVLSTLYRTEEDILIVINKVGTWF